MVVVRAIVNRFQKTCFVTGLEVGPGEGFAVLFEGSDQWRVVHGDVVNDLPARPGAFRRTKREAMEERAEVARTEATRRADFLGRTPDNDDGDGVTQMVRWMSERVYGWFFADATTAKETAKYVRCFRAEGWDRTVYARKGGVGALARRHGRKSVSADPRDPRVRSTEALPPTGSSTG